MIFNICLLFYATTVIFVIIKNMLYIYNIGIDWEHETEDLRKVLSKNKSNFVAGFIMVVVLLLGSLLWPIVITYNYFNYKEE